MSQAIKLTTGALMPSIGLGTWKSKQGEVGHAVSTAIDVGYRHIDCAFAYQNEEEIGKVLQEKFNKGIVKREDIFITSKLWSTYHQPPFVKAGFMITLRNLKLDYLDLFLMHWPTALKPGKGFLPKGNKGELCYDDVGFVNTWQAMEKLVDQGLCKAIGVSNFNKEQLEGIVTVAKHPIAVVQVESHPYFSQNAMIEYCKSKNIVFTAYSPLGCPDRPRKFDADEPQPLRDAVVREIAAKHKKSPAQILIRFQIERDLVVIPKSVSPDRIQENFEVFDFKLSGDDMTKLLALNKDFRLIHFDLMSKHPHYPFELKT
ncbi:aldo-keto reductase family 1 member B1-like [Glandiceps talaboti]